MAEADSISTPSCPLCGNGQTEFYHRDRAREYCFCTTCSLVFVPSKFFLTPASEKAQYDHHQNNPADQRYRHFLGRLFDPLSQQLQPQSSGLDFGSGPGPTLSIMFEEIGHTMAIYDPFYAPDRTVLNQTYDFITATEVVEHLHNPKVDLTKLWDLIKVGGWLGIMTKRTLDLEAFSQWHYKNDPTHVCFFNKKTFVYLAEKWNASYQFYGSDVVLFQKKSPPSARG